VAAGVIANRERGNRRGGLCPRCSTSAPPRKGTAKTYAGYYDGHKDTYVVTDVSSKSQAAAMNINYSPPLAKVKGRARRSNFIQGKGRTRPARRLRLGARARPATTRSGRS